MANRSANLSFHDQSDELPIYSPTLGADVIDVSALGKQSIYTFDPGYTATASCESTITFIDGGKGMLLYRGYPIDQLADQCDFMEICYLLMYGELPDKKQKDWFVNKIKYHTMVDEQLIKFYGGFRRSAHPMAIMVGIVGALSAFYHDSLDINNPAHREMSAFRLIAKMPTLAAMCYKYHMGHPFMYPQNRMSYAENFLYMMYGTPAEDYQPNPVISRALEIIFILHADHEQNASTSTVRMAGSTGANPFACISAGIGALWGPAHGGANEAALNMMYRIGDESKINDYIKKAKDKNDPFRLMGFGHRVYKNYDPRAKVMQKICHQVLEEVGRHNDPILKLAMKLEKIALEDDYFVERKLYPNIDFYSGITLNAIGIPTNMFTVIFALARTVGWISHWMEMMSDPNYKLCRPRQLYTGPAKRDVVPLEERN